LAIAKTIGEDPISFFFYLFHGFNLNFVFHNFQYTYMFEGCCGKQALCCNFWKICFNFYQFQLLLEIGEGAANN
jgi:hypothetical protein